jgi:hypothetical protein
MGIPVKALRDVMLAVGFVPAVINPHRRADGRPGVTITALYAPDLVATPVAEEQPERMIVQPAPGYIHVDELRKIKGIGAKTVASVEEYLEVKDATE